MFKTLPSTRVLCEPESFYSAYKLFHEEKCITLEEYNHMLKSIVMIHCMTNHKRIFFKMVSGPGNSQMEILHELFPSSKTAFLSRSREAVVGSMMRIIRMGHPRPVQLLGYSRESLVSTGIWATDEKVRPGMI